MTRPLLLLMDARYTRVDVHDGISRYGASLIEAVHRTADPGRVRVEMLISDERQLRLLPAGVPWHRISSPTSGSRSRLAPASTQACISAVWAGSTWRVSS